MNSSLATVKGGLVPMVVAAACGLWILVVRGIVPFPLVSDHAYFLPASWWLAQTGQLANPWMQPGFNSALNWHGFVQPWLIGELARLDGGGWSGVYLAVNLLAAATVLTVAWSARAMGLSSLRSISVVLVAAALMLDARSRPEVLSTFETALLAALCWDLAKCFPQSGWRGAGIGAICAAIGCTHPAVALFAVVGVSVWLAMLILEGSASPAKYLTLIGAMAGGFVLTLAALFMIVFGGDVTIWLHGMSEAGKLTLARTDTGGLLRYFLANRFVPGFGVLLLPLAAAALAALWPRGGVRRPALRAVVGLLAGIAVLALAYRLALRIPATYYNLTGLMAALCLVAAALPLGPVWRRVVDIALLAAGASALAGLVVWTAQAVADWPQVADARQALAASIVADETAGKRVCADASALAALDSVDVARAVSVSLRLSEAPAAPDPAVCDVFYAVQATAASSSSLAGFVAERSTVRDNLFSKAGLRPSYLAFTRWVSETKG